MTPRAQSKADALTKAKTSRTAKRKGDYVQRRVRIRRTNEDISNDMSEGMPVTPGEVRRCLQWERGHTFKLQNTINRLRDAMVRVGLTLADGPCNPRQTECLLTISRALKHPNIELDHLLEHVAGDGDDPAFERNLLSCVGSRRSPPRQRRDGRAAGVCA